MKIAFYNMYETLNDQLFTARNAPIGDDLLLPFLRLKEEATRRGVEVHAVTQDHRTWTDNDALVFLDFPFTGSLGDQLLGAFRGDRYLITFENALVRHENFRPDRHALFAKVFTWNDELVADNPDRYVKLNYAQEFVRGLEPAQPRDLCCLIASNKSNPHPDALYSERVRAIRWFEDYAPTGAFSLYGPGWAGAPSWRGVIPCGLKRVVLKNYKFSIVFENAREPGYITEKIFDAFIAGTVPVYLGAPNIGRWIDPACFVDGRRFLLLDPMDKRACINYERLYEHLRTMPRAEYEAYRAAILNWMTGIASRPFTCETFAKTILNVIMEER